MRWAVLKHPLVSLHGRHTQVPHTLPPPTHPQKPVAHLKRRSLYDKAPPIFPELNLLAFRQGQHEGQVIALDSFLMSLRDLYLHSLGARRVQRSVDHTVVCL